MIKYDEALRMILNWGADHPLPAETVDLMSALGKVTESDIVSPEEVPAFDNSAMDGFAVNSSRTNQASKDKPILLPVTGTVAAGEDSSLVGTAAGAVEIMTGAPMPPGEFDAVVRVEDIEWSSGPEGERCILLRRPVTQGENVRLSGTDYRVGQVVVGAGTPILPVHQMALASLGISRLKVRRLPQVAVISTGKELAPYAEQKLAPGMIRNSTAPFLLSSLQLYGIQARYYGVVADEPEVFQQSVRKAIEDGADLVISTGAVSMGKYDFVLPALKAMGARLIFHKCAIRPGKPLLFAEVGSGSGNAAKGRIPFFGVPGNPVSTAVALRFFIDPLLRQRLRLPREEPGRALLDKDLSKPPGLRCFYKARIASQGGRLRVTPVRGQESYKVSPLLDSNAWVVFEEEGDRILGGTEVNVLPLYGSFLGGVFHG